MRLTLVDTVGYGDQINKGDSFNSIVEYIDNQFEAYLQVSIYLSISILGYVGFIDQINKGDSFNSSMAEYIDNHFKAYVQVSYLSICVGGKYHFMYWDL